MFKCIFLSGLFIITAMTSNAQYDENYEIKYNTVRKLLGGGRPGQAFKLLEELYAIDPLNHYTNYLMGVCYTEQNIVTEKSMEHLEYAVKDILDEYGHIPYTETRAPMFAWYYLTKAYSQNGYCAKARNARDMFIEVYGKDKSDYFTNNINKFLIECSKNEWLIKQHARKNSVETKTIDYTTLSPLYGVQVGAYAEFVPVREFYNLKNVKAFMDNEGVIRYVIGHFVYVKQAENLLKAVKEAGYEDAFIVDVNKERKYTEEVIIVDNMSFKAQLRGKVEFRVQIGAFRDSIPENLVRIYLKIDGIKENIQDDLTVLTSGSFDTYEEAESHKQELTKMRVPEPFVVSYNQGMKISVEQAQYYLRNKKDREPEGN